MLLRSPTPWSRLSTADRPALPAIHLRARWISRTRVNGERGSPHDSRTGQALISAIDDGVRWQLFGCVVDSLDAELVTFRIAHDSQGRVRMHDGGAEGDEAGHLGLDGALGA